MSACEKNMTEEHGELFMKYHDGPIHDSSRSENLPVLLTDFILEKDLGGYCSHVTCIMISTQRKH